MKPATSTLESTVQNPSPAQPVRDTESGVLTPVVRAFFTSRDRRAIGRWAEDLSAKFLESQGAEIIGRNVKVSYSELDIICRLEDELVFVEVRCRRKSPSMSAVDTLGPQKWRHLARGAEYYVQEHGWSGAWRIDLITIDVEGGSWALRWLKYLEMEEC